jgi:histone-lysine N-methyltransferase SUV39H
MRDAAARTSTTLAAYRIAAAFDLRLSQASGTGPRLSLVNNIDSSRPSLQFQFITKCVIGQDVKPVDGDAVVGCGARIPGEPQYCKPDMGQNIGCEYTRVCDCLEYADVDVSRLNAEQKLLFEQGEVARLPKRFPYHVSKSDTPPLLQALYLNSRSPIYECNPRCNCGSNCKTRNVQHGRQVPLEIFKTKTRGWGLRSTVDLQRGQFIDCYVGEILTSEETDRREEGAGAGKASYLYSLDKFACRGDDACDAPNHDTQCLKPEDCYVIDGEFMGNVTRFINHSCKPNCRQYTVSYNKYDQKVYELAFFAYEHIRAGTELTFDYLDRDDVDEEPEGELDTTFQRCMCGAKGCRGSFGFSSYEK